jgi:hypothetical protein
MRRKSIRLTLNRETLRNLTQDVLRAAAGGANTSVGNPCAATCRTCAAETCTKTCPELCGTTICVRTCVLC